jgi:uncharacterized protein GlcG (DUF336 family)
MKLTRFAVLLVTTVALSASAFSQGLPTQKMLTFDLALTIAQDALAKCRADGYKVTVTVVDSTNTVKVVLHDDGAAIATVDVGRRKATSVIVFGRPSGPRVTPGVAAQPPTPGTTDAVGGFPIKVGDQIIGAVSVAGAPGPERDTACATAGLANVADRLK